MAARDVIKNQNLYVDGRGYAGQLQKVMPPKLTLVTEDARMGGMDAPLKLTMGMEGMDASFELISYDRDVLALWGLREGRLVPLTIREALESFDGTVKAVVHSMRCKVIELDSGEHEPGKIVPLKVAVNCATYKQTHDGVVVHDIDIENMKRIINGVDQLAEQRAALGL